MFLLGALGGAQRRKGGLVVVPEGLLQDSRRLLGVNVFVADAHAAQHGQQGVALAVTRRAVTPLFTVCPNLRVTSPPARRRRRACAWTT